MTGVTTSLGTIAIGDLIDRYIAIWNETDENTRRNLIARTWTAEGTYTDPLLKSEGRDGIDAMTAGFQATYPDHRFERDGDCAFDQGKLRFGWKLIQPTGETFITGEDVCTLSDEGLFASITGTFNQ